MDYLPLFVDIRDQRCLVVGGGVAARSKIELLRRAGAVVVVVAPRLQGDLARDAAHGLIEHYARSFAPSDVTDARLVIAATGLREVDGAVALAAMAANVPVNVVDDAEAGNVIMPAIVDRSPLVIAISSAGTAPVLTRHLRARIESLIPTAYGRLAELAGTFRSTVKAVISDSVARRRFWEQVIEGPIAETALRGDAAEAREQLISLLNSEPDTFAANTGEVYLIGAGPGDPDLLTFRALRLLQKADVVVHDRLVGAGILDYARREAERIYVGKSKHHHAKSQAEINDLMVAHARAGQRVARLKGGDPFIFGRGGEELSALTQAGIHIEVVPGITAGLACAAYAGIPLTHRDLAQSCVFVTGHEKDGVLDLNWPALATPNQTLVLYMGLSSIDLFAAQLIAHGRDSATPAAIIEKGTLPDQRIIAGSLSELPRLAQTHRVKGPAVIVIGEVVKLRAALGDGVPSLNLVPRADHGGGVA